MDITSPSDAPKPARSSSAATAAPPETLSVALAGNPNSGKTSLFNALTGLRRKIGNYPGVTVERIVGRMTFPDGGQAEVIDLPGCYSLGAISADERVARDVLLGLEPGTDRPDVIVAVVDASNLKRNLYFATQLLEVGLPLVVALNMIDVAERRGTDINTSDLTRALGVPVVPVVARTGAGTDQLKNAIRLAAVAPSVVAYPEAAERALDHVRAAVESSGVVPREAAGGEALRLLTIAEAADPYLERGGDAVGRAVTEGREMLAAAGLDRESLEADARYAACDRIVAAAVTEGQADRTQASERADRVLTHRALGPLIFLGIMALIFQTIYAWAEPFMNVIDAGTGWLAAQTVALLGPGMLTDLLTDGVIAGVGNVVIFLPQICLLFLFLTILEDCGYLSRAAFLVDRVMRAAGLSGKSFIPLMSSFACAIPGIMAARTIESRRDRMVTILIAPFMSCSARLPVYLVMIGAFMPAHQGVALLGMYLLSVVVAMVAAWVFRKTLFRGEASPFLMELPSYKLPGLRHVLRTTWSRGMVFVKQAGTIILVISVVLWALQYFPRSDAIEQQAEQRIAAGEDEGDVGNWAASAQQAQSYAGRIGKAIEPTIAPLGFDWKVGVGLVASFAAREVMVSSLGVMYAVGDDADEESIALREKLQNAKKPDGSPSFTWLTALSLMVFFVLASQCMSTLAIVKRETNSWRWPIFMFVYMTVLAWIGSFIVYQGGLALGWGT